MNGTGVLTDGNTITIDGTTVTFTASTPDNLTDLVALIEAANIANISAEASSNNLVIEKSTGADITIAGTGTILADVGITAGTIARTASTALDVAENAEIDGTLTVGGDTTLSGNLTVSGNITGGTGFTDNVIDIGVDSANTTPLVLEVSSTGNRFAYFAWSKQQ